MNLYVDYFYSNSTGSPSDLFDENNIDWAPTVNLGHDKVKPKSSSAVKRVNRTNF